MTTNNRLLMRLKSQAQLEFIIKDAGEAAVAMRGVDTVAECKYLDQVNDASDELASRRRAGTTCPECGQGIKHLHRR